MKKLKMGFLRGFFTLVAVIVTGAIAYFAHIPFLFPSLGPTAYLLFYKPRTVDASPKHAVLGNLIGAISGYIGLAVFGLVGVTPHLTSGINFKYVGSATIALVLTSVFMHRLKIEHPPAGATTLIIALGIINTAPELVVMMCAVIALVIIGWLCNHATGINYPVWNFYPEHRKPKRAKA